MTPSRVLMTTDAVGGVLTYALTLARQLTARGIAIDLAVLGPPPRDDQRRAMRDVPGVTVHELECALEWMDEPWDDVERSAEWLRDLERRTKPDLVHVNGYAHAAAGFDAPVVAVAHSCVVSWWDAVFGEEAPAPYDRYRREVRRGLAEADVVVAPSTAMLECLRRFHRFTGGLVVPNGAPVPERIRRKERFVLACGRLWDRAKNVAAVARVASRTPWPVSIAGDGAENESGVRHLGWLAQGELSEVMERAAIFAAPALYEPFGLSALEAGLRSCALVLGDIDSQREIWGDAAIFVDPRDDEALAAAIVRLCENEPLRGWMGERAWRRALAYSPGRMADGTLDAYAAASAKEEPSAGAVSCAS